MYLCTTSRVRARQFSSVNRATHYFALWISFKTDNTPLSLSLSLTRLQKIEKRSVTPVQRNQWMCGFFFYAPVLWNRVARVGLQASNLGIHTWGYSRGMQCGDKKKLGFSVWHDALPALAIPSLWQTKQDLDTVQVTPFFFLRISKTLPRDFFILLCVHKCSMDVATCIHLMQRRLKFLASYIYMMWYLGRVFHHKILRFFRLDGSRARKTVYDHYYYYETSAHARISMINCLAERSVVWKVFSNTLYCCYYVVL